jgi:Fic family protein
VKQPRVPPPTRQILSSLSLAEFTQVFLQQPTPLVHGHYLHWDELRHRTPPQGLSHDLWWLSIKTARTALAQPLPVTDKNGKAFTFGVPEPVQVHLHHVDQDAAGEIRAPGQITPDRRNEYLVRSLIEEAITSSQLEGASTTRQVAVEMLREGRKPKDHSELMIFNNFRTMQSIQAFRNEPVTVERLLELHALIAEGTLPDPSMVGRFRSSDDVRVVDTVDGAILHQPPSHLELQARMESLCAFANASEKERPFVHPVIRAILLHFMVGYIHPFQDGNGRTARALFYWSMLRSGYWLTEFLTISRVLKEAPAQYGRAYLFTETDEGDTTYFILHQLETIRKAIDGLHEYLARKTREQRSVERLLDGSIALRGKLNHRQRSVLAHALKHPETSYRIDAYQRSHGIVYETARMDLIELENLGFLYRSKEGHAFVFTPPTDLAEKIQAFKG